MLQKSIKHKLNTDNEDNIKLIYQPTFFNLKQIKDENELDTLLTSNPNIEILDEIDGQIEELIKLRNPQKKLTTKELKDKTKIYLNSTPKEKIGVWVYYPWLNKLIHLLDESEFVEVRTNRNQYKITPYEEDVLATKTIGIIGLSVGKAIATTIAMERICGELIIADFDVIELSNLNRIQTGVHNFNVKKTTVVAREIAEIDPYLKVTCLDEGLTEENMAEFFFSKGKKIDLCIEVCDGLTTKIYARQKAKELGIPVIMNSSDRGTTDIERYDLDKTLPILHGLIEHLDLNLVKEAKTNEEKVPYLLPMLGVETSSERLKASMLEIESTITTWPQLASGVVMGGGICTDVSRRILLNQFTNSGRYFVDVETLINNDVEDYIVKSKKRTETVQLIPNTTIEDYQSILNDIEINDHKNSLKLSKSTIEKLVNHAIMAPSGGNMQPWKWIYQNKTLYLFNDINRINSILNYKNSATLISLGAATENLILKAHQLGYDVKLNKFPLGLNKDLIACFSFFMADKKLTKKESHLQDYLVEFIPKRLTNRNLSNKSIIKPEILCLLNKSIETINGAELKLFTDSKKIESIKNILAEVDKLYLTNEVGHKNFTEEIRWNKKEAKLTKDGVDLETLDITPTEKAGLIVSKDWDVTKHINNWKLGDSFSKLTKKGINSASAIGLIIMPQFNANNYFDGGRALEKIWLTATANNISFQPMSISTFLFSRIKDNNFEKINAIKNDLINLSAKFKQICEIEGDKQEIFLFRLSHAHQPTTKALRREIKDVLIL